MESVEPHLLGAKELGDYVVNTIESLKALTEAELRDLREVAESIASTPDHFVTTELGMYVYQRLARVLSEDEKEDPGYQCLGPLACSLVPLDVTYIPHSELLPELAKRELVRDCSENHKEFLLESLLSDHAPLCGAE